jgi:hypothetical protein
MAAPPDQSAYDLLDLEPYRQELKPFDFPPIPRPQPRPSAITGLAPGQGTAHRDSLTDLTLGDQFRLLAENNVDLLARHDKQGGKAGVMRAVVVNATLAPSPRYAVRFTELKLQPHGLADRFDTVSHSYSEFESNLQRQLVVAAKIGGGIPKIFNLDASYNDASAMQQNEREVTIYLQSSQFLPKAQVAFNVSHLSVDPEFVREVESACSARRPAEQLLKVLREFGHFVPTSIYLGGRITLLTSDEQIDRSQYEKVEREFGTAARARFKVDAVPVEAGAGGGVLSQTTSTETLSQQAESLKMELMGGNEDLASSEAGTLGSKWIASLGPFMSWRTIGYGPESLVPIIDFLPGALKEKCIAILKAYFLSQLDCRRGDFVGAQHGEPFDSDISRVRRIVEIVVNGEGDVNGLQWTFEQYDGKKITRGESGRYGKFRSNWQTGTGQKGTPIILKEDEELVAIEAGIDRQSAGIIKQIAFVTNRKRWPGDKGYYGRNRVDYYKTITAPRVRGLFGSAENLIHSVGLNYLGLANDANSREFLLAMEPYLFPDYDYGVVE